MNKVNPQITGVPVLIDGDILAYRAASVLNWDEDYVQFSDAHSLRRELEDTIEPIVNSIIRSTRNLTTRQEFEGYDGPVGEFYLTGPGNFRYDLAKSYPYKGNRSAGVKPIALPYCRDYLQLHYDAVVSDGEEADDLISKRSTELMHDCVIVSVDKDFLQLPCWHFNTMHESWSRPSPTEAMMFFYSQVLTGDVADNIKGLYGIGPKKAAAILEGCNTESEMYKAVLEAYGEDQLDYLVENARLLWLRRKDDELWEPPTSSEVD